MYRHSVWAAPGLYRDDVDRLEFPRHLARVTRSIGWKCVAYCLMKTHHHLIVRVDDDVLPRAMHRLNLAYARQHNRRHGLRGHVQFERYGSRRLHNEVELMIAFVRRQQPRQSRSLRLSCCVALEQLHRDRGRDGTRLLCGSNRAHPRVRRPGDRPASRTAHFRGGGVTVPYRYLLPVCRLGGGYLL